MSIQNRFGLARVVVASVTAMVLSATSPTSAADDGDFVSASSIHSEPYLPKYAVDGDAQTRWASVVFSDKPQWLQIDFGKTVPVEKLVIRNLERDSCIGKLQIDSL